MPPIIAGQNAPVAVESDNTADDDVAITFTWTNVTYTGSLDAQVSKTSDEDDLDAIVVDEVSSIIAIAVADIRCGDLGFCDLLPCVDSLFNKAYNEAWRERWMGPGGSEDDGRFERGQYHAGPLP